MESGMPNFTGSVKTKPSTRCGAVKIAVRGSSLVSHVFTVIGGLFFCAVASVLLWVLFSGPVWDFVASRTWEETPAVVARCEVVEAKNGAEFQLLLEYSYQFAGAAHTGRKVDIGVNEGPETGSHAEMSETAERYPVGKEMVCWVNPERPEEVVLDRSFPWMVVPIFLFVTPFGLIGLAQVAYGLGFFAWWKKRREARRAKEMADNPFVGAAKTAEENSPEKGKAGRLPMQWFLRLFGIPFAAAGLFVLSLGIREETALQRSQDWVETPCEVLKSLVKRSSGSKKSTYSVYVRYRYVWEGKEMLGERYNFSSGSDSEYEPKKAAVRNYPAGKKTVCWVNPAQPSEAVLVRERGDLWILPWGLGVVFTLVGSGIFFGSFFMNRKRRFAAEEMQRSGPLPVRGRPAGKFWAGLAFAAFWNGFVSIFTVLAVQQYRAGEMEWFLFGFVGLFQLIGILLAVRALWLALALLGARLTVTAKRVVARGEKVPIGWEFSKEPHGVGSFKLRAECVRVHVDGNAQERKQEEEIVLRIPILEREDGQIFLRGDAAFSIPESARSSSNPEEIVTGLAMSKLGEERFFWQIVAEVKHRRRPVQVWKFGLGVR